MYMYMNKYITCSCPHYNSLDHNVHFLRPVNFFRRKYKVLELKFIRCANKRKQR